MYVDQNSQTGSQKQNSQFKRLNNELSVFDIIIFSHMHSLAFRNHLKSLEKIITIIRCVVDVLICCVDRYIYSSLHISSNFFIIYLCIRTHFGCHKNMVLSVFTFFRHNVILLTQSRVVKPFSARTTFKNSQFYWAAQHINPK